MCFKFMRMWKEQPKDFYNKAPLSGGFETKDAERKVNHATIL